MSPGLRLEPRSIKGELTRMAQRAILILEADEKTVPALRRSLSNEPYSLMFASKVSEALDLLESHPLEVVISSSALPEMTGEEFLKQVRRRRPETMRILLSSQQNLSSSIEAVVRGEIFRFLTEPWDEIELRGVIRGALERLQCERENRRLLARVRGEVDAAIEGIGSEPQLVRDRSGAILLEDSEGEKVTVAVS
jgi:DNA-binding NtrC family response regulator